MSLRSELRGKRLERNGDDRKCRDLDLEEVLRRARAGTLLGGNHRALRELQAWCGHLSGEAEDLVSCAVSETRALSRDEDREVRESFEGVAELRALIDKIAGEIRAELSDPKNLIPISPRY